MSRRLEKRALLSLIGDIYDAVGEGELWPEVLLRIRQAVGATSANLLAQEVGALAIPFTVISGWEPGALAEYVAHYAAVDSFLEAGVKRFGAGQLLTDETLLTPTEYRRSEYTNDFLQRWNAGRVLGAVLSPPSGNVVFSIGLHRPLDARPFGSEEAAVLRALVPHLQRACKLQARLGHLLARHAEVESLLDQLPFGTVFVDDHSKVLMMNSAAAELLRRHDGVELCDQELVMTTASERARFRQLVGSAAASGAGRDLGHGGSMSVSRTSAMPLHLSVSPIHARSEMSRASAVVIIFDPTRGPNCVAVTLQQMYGVSTAEARVVEQLLKGSSLQEASEALRVSRHTARAQLKSVLHKTGSRTQAQLMKTLLRGPIGLA